MARYRKKPLAQLEFGTRIGCLPHGDPSDEVVSGLSGVFSDMATSLSMALTRFRLARF